MISCLLIIVLEYKACESDTLPIRKHLYLVFTIIDFKRRRWNNYKHFSAYNVFLKLFSISSFFQNRIRPLNMSHHILISFIWQIFCYILSYLNSDIIIILLLNCFQCKVYVLGSLKTLAQHIYCNISSLSVLWQCYVVFSIVRKYNW